MPTVSSDTRVHATIRENFYTCGLPPRIINVLAEVGSIEAVRDGEYLFRQGDDAAAVYLVRSGTVWLQSVVQEDGIHIWNVPEGGLVGWSCLTPPFKCLLDARAYGDLEVVRLNAHELRAMLPMDHELGYHIFQVLLRAASERLHPDNLATPHAPWPHPLLLDRKV